MVVLLVRHAHAASRAKWEEDDADRPLSTKGRDQAQKLVSVLGTYRPSRILSSPYLRCVDTIGPLAETLGVEVEIDDRLAEGGGSAAVELVRSLADQDVAVCSHGDVLPTILVMLANEDDLNLGPMPRVEKASAWVLEPGAGRFASAAYLEPPRVRS
ncbi:MAG: histidine phosphatase family protein [Acidimicrobiales bacterium]|nr:histidine phosphatase family protein [Acidimicrobiales bacterium]